MSDVNSFFVLREKAVPEVLLKVVEAKKLMEKHKVKNVQEAVERVGISRSSFYKYKDDIYPFSESDRGISITLSLLIEDRPGILSQVLKAMAEGGANILTIHQSIPVNAVASISLSIQILPGQSLSESVRELEALDGILEVKVLAREQIN